MSPWTDEELLRATATAGQLRKEAIFARRERAPHVSLCQSGAEIIEAFVRWHRDSRKGEGT